jgi:hypothetical protein
METETSDLQADVDRYLERLTLDYYGENGICACSRRRLTLEQPPKNRPELIVLRKVKIHRAKSYA